jgi:hypothetical protein
VKLAALLLVPVLVLAGPTLPTWHGDPARAPAELERQWRVIANTDQPVGIRGTLRFAVEAAGVGWEPERVTAALARARACQDLTPGSLTRGNFKWRSDHPRVLDLNGGEFALQLLGYLHAAHAARLNEKSRELVRAMLLDGVEGLRLHEVRVDYTNIFVMKCWGLIAAGEALGRAEIAEDGYQRFEAWLRHTARNGIGEYGAVTYYGIDLDSLALIARFAQRPAARAQAMTAIRYFWTDIAANWWAPGDRLASANARSYDYLFGRGYLEAHTWTAGWLRTRPELEGAGWIHGPQPNETVFRDAVALPPDPAWTEPIRQQIPRTIVQRWGELPPQRAVAWIGRNVSLASSGASRGTDERTLVANLGATPAVTQVNLFMDGRGDPFGSVKTANAAGQAKALHPMPFIATVQREADVLQLLSLLPGDPGTRTKAGELSCLLSHLTLPSSAEVWNGETRMTRDAALAADQPLFIRLGAGTLAVRVLGARATDGTPASVALITDSPRNPARRITITHAAQSPRGRGTLAIWFQAADGLDEAGFATFRREFTARKFAVRNEGATLHLTAAGRQGELRLSANPERQTREVLAGGEPDALLSVNGIDHGQALLAAWRGKAP